MIECGVFWLRKFNVESTQFEPGSVWMSRTITKSRASDRCYLDSASFWFGAGSNSLSPFFNETSQEIATDRIKFSVWIGSTE